jgi:hypothetical protein
MTIHPALSSRHDQSQFLSAIHHGWNSGRKCSPQKSRLREIRFSAISLINITNNKVPSNDP